jgi:RNA recognition motif-containing protein
MHCIRRAALRSAASAARGAAPKAPSTQFASQFTGNKVTAKQCSVSIARFFSQSARVAADETTEQIKHVEPESSQQAYQKEGPEVIPSTEESESRQSKQDRAAQVDLPNGIFIRNFVFDVTEGHLTQMFGKFGNVVDARIVRDARGLSKGYAFVFMESEDAMKKAISELDGTFWHGRRIGVAARGNNTTSSKGGRGSRPPPVEPTKFLFIGNIPYEATDAELNKMFRELHNVEDVRVAVDRVTGWPRGFAHADFADVESAKKAMEKLSGFELNGRPLRVDYAQGLGDSRKNSGSRGSRSSNE